MRLNSARSVVLDVTFVLLISSLYCWTQISGRFIQASQCDIFLHRSASVRRSSSSTGSICTNHPYYAANASTNNGKFSNRRRRRRNAKKIVLSSSLSSPAAAATTTATTAVGTDDTETTTDESYRYPTWDELSTGQKILAGSVQIALSFGLDYIQAYVGAYILGTITGVPQLIFKGANDMVNNNIPPGATAPMKSAHPFSPVREASARFGRMHRRSIKWSKSWAPISSIFGGFGTTTRILRNNKEDEWNTIISSAAAGAYFSRQKGPQGMLRGALMYGGITYIFSSNAIFKNPSNKVEEDTREIDFQVPSLSSSSNDID